MNLRNIVTGWSKGMGLMEVTEAERTMSTERLNVCATCSFAKESSMLLLIKGSAEDMAAIYCGKCKCPVNEKSLVAEESCPEGFWNE